MVSGPEARRRIRRFISASGGSAGELRSFWREAPARLGPFTQLPADLQAALSTAAYRWFQERNLLVSDRVYRLAHGPVFRLGGWLAHRGWRGRQQARGGRRFWRAVFFLGRALTEGSRWAARRWLERTRFWPTSRTHVVCALWHRIGFDPTDLIQDYVESIPQDPRAAPVHAPLQRGGAASAALFGLDLLASEGRLYLLEANFNPGFRASRLELYPDGDPVARGLTGYAAERGYARVVYYPYSKRALFPAELERSWREIGASAGVAVEIRDDPYFRSPYRRSCDPLIDLTADGVAYVNGRFLESPLGALVSRKDLLDREIERYNRGRSEPDRILVPRRVRTAADLAPVDGGGRFPNLIVKDVRVDQAHGITLYRTDELPEYTADPRFQAYEYVRPDRVAEDGHRPGDRVFIYRAYLLVAPDAAVYLGARKDISAIPLCGRLGVGRIEDPRPYLTNLHLGDYSVRPGPGEDERLEETVGRIGAMFRDFLERKHGGTAVADAGVLRTGSR